MRTIPSAAAIALLMSGVALGQEASPAPSGAEKSTKTRVLETGAAILQRNAPLSGMDIYLDGMEDLKTMNGFQICRHLVDSYPQIRILAHSVYDDADRVAGILKAGSWGFVSKKSGYEELISGIKTVYRGQKYICGETSRRLKNLNKFLLGIEDNLRSKDEVFSQREREVLELLSEGKSSREIAEQLFITERTVESHRKNMIEKGKVKNNVELIAYASSIGLIKK